MESDSLKIVPCPPEFVAEAVSLVLADLVPSQRREIAGGLLALDDPAELANVPLYVALRGGELRAAAWGQRQTGNVALFWPPQLADGEEEATAVRLAEAVVRVLDDIPVGMIQVLLPASDAAAVPVVEAVGFRQLAELLYMSCEAERFPTAPPDTRGLEFEPYRDAARRRLAAIVERTYEETLDCVGLDGKRTIDDVIDGYQQTGVFRPDHWQLARCRDEDVGVLLLADHPQARHWELMYMGLAPASRGQGWGGRITEYAKWLGRRAGIERIVLAVDTANMPALRMYGTAGFEVWDRRTVYVRFPATPTR